MAALLGLTGGVRHLPAGLSSHPVVGLNLEVLNLAQARFECTYGRGCDGICCRKGRPPLYPDEIARIDARLPDLIPRLRPAARAVVQTRGYLTRQTPKGRLRARVAGGWCIFFHAGCVLHQAGLAEGDPFRYKPAACALFPLDRDLKGRWYVRQKGYRGERWDLFCLDPTASSKPAVESLQQEMALAHRFTVESGA